MLAAAAAVMAASAAAEAAAEAAAVVIIHQMIEAFQDYYTQVEEKKITILYLCVMKDNISGLFQSNVAEDTTRSVYTNNTATTVN